MSVEGVMNALANDYPAYRAIEKAEPETYRRMRAVVADGLAAGASAGDIAAQMRAEIKEVYLRRLRTAPDDLIVAYAGFMEDALLYLEQHDPQNCVSLVSSKPPSGSGGFGAELNRRDSDILSRIVTTPAVEQAFASQDEAVDAAHSAAAAAAAELHESEDAFADALGGKGGPTEQCRTWCAFVGQVRRVGTSRPAILRSLFLN
jgi:hypothetical protein